MGLIHRCSRSCINIFIKINVLPFPAGHSDSLSDTEVSSRSNIIRPLSIPSAPFIFQDIVSQRHTSQLYARIQTGNVEEENYQTAVAIRSRPKVC
jgi:hypothetical protein